MADGLQQVRALLEDVLQQEVHIEGLRVVLVVEGVGAVVEQLPVKLFVLFLFFLQVGDHLFGGRGQPLLLLPCICGDVSHWGLIIMFDAIQLIGIYLLFVDLFQLLLFGDWLLLY